MTITQAIEELGATGTERNDALSAELVARDSYSAQIGAGLRNHDLDAGRAALYAATERRANAERAYQAADRQYRDLATK